VTSEALPESPVWAACSSAGCGGAVVVVVVAGGAVVVVVAGGAVVVVVVVAGSVEGSLAVVGDGVSAGSDVGVAFGSTAVLSVEVVLSVAAPVALGDVVLAASTWSIRQSNWNMHESG
jgi:hypothetical protein